MAWIEIRNAAGAGTVAGGRTVRNGEIVEVGLDEARFLVALGKALPADPPRPKKARKDDGE